VILEQEGLVHNGSQGRAVIAPMDAELIADIYDLRELVDPYSAARAAQTDFDPAPLWELIKKGRQAVPNSRVSELIQLDLRFHNHIYGLSRNRVVMEVMRAQWSHIRRAMMLTLTPHEYRRRAWDEHEAILKAIVGQQPSRAHTLACAHAKDARAFLLANVDKLTKAGQGAHA
jgi:DNA-binding GntR family transcriptional regulator